MERQRDRNRCEFINKLSEIRTTVSLRNTTLVCMRITKAVAKGIYIFQRERLELFLGNECFSIALYVDGV